MVAYFSGHAAFVATGDFAAIAGIWVWLYCDESRPDAIRVNASKPVTDATLVAPNAAYVVLKGPRFRAWTAMLVATYSMLFCFLLSSGFVYI